MTDTEKIIKDATIELLVKMVILEFLYRKLLKSLRSAVLLFIIISDLRKDCFR